MRTSKLGIRRVLPLLALLALAPLAFLGCESAGDDAGLPTGPSTKYTPGMDLPGAKIIVVDPPNSHPGESFDVLAYFSDGNGRPVEGIYLMASDEGPGWFTFDTNPTITNPAGAASITVNVSAACPEGSYTIVVQGFPAWPSNAPFAVGYAHVRITGTGGAAVTSVTLTTSTPSVTLPNDPIFTVMAVATPGCTVNLEYQAAGAGLSVPWTPVPGTTNSRIFTLDPTAAGPLTVIAGAYCSEDPSAGVVSAPVTVTVAAAPGP